jgi:hypothetical protein
MIFGLLYLSETSILPLPNNIFLNILDDEDIAAESMNCPKRR